jgi:CubicO group peptidase (beta-lactamase class C family)
MRRRQFLTQAGRGVVCALLPFGVSVPRPTQGRASEAARIATLTAGLERRIPDWLRASNVPGLSIVLVQGAGVAWRRSFGLKDVESKAAVESNTLFEAASMSKPVFAYVVMKLCETGVIGLDVPLTTYVSERFLEGDSRLDLITARHVLSHTSGFQNWRSEKEPLAIHFTPGSQYLYSGEGYNYLQTVVTKLLGQSFETFMTKRLFEPFGMTSSRYVWNDEAARQMARPHDPDGKPIDNNKSTESGVARYGSAGALLTTPTDYAKFVSEVIDPKPADAFRLKPENVREMLRPHVKLEGGMYPASWALGWQVFHNKDRDFIYHGGDNKGFHCSVVASVAGQSGFVAMTNGENGTAVLRNLLTLDFMQEFLLS